MLSRLQCHACLLGGDDWLFVIITRWWQTTADKTSITWVTSCRGLLLLLLLTTAAASLHLCARCTLTLQRELVSALRLSKNHSTTRTCMWGGSGSGSSSRSRVVQKRVRRHIAFQPVSKIAHRHSPSSTSSPSTWLCSAAHRDQDTRIRLMHLLGNGASSSSVRGHLPTVHIRSSKSPREATLPRCFPPYVTCRTCNATSRIIVHPTITDWKSCSFHLALIELTYCAHLREFTIRLLMTFTSHSLTTSL